MFDPRAALWHGKYSSFHDGIEAPESDDAVLPTRRLSVEGLSKVIFIRW